MDGTVEVIRTATSRTRPFYSHECSSSRSVRSWSPRNRALHLPSSPIKIAIRKSKGVLRPLLRSFRSSLSSSAASTKQMTSKEKGAQVETPSMKLLFVEMGVGYDQHGFGLAQLTVLLMIRQDITAAAMRACRDAISSNSIPAFRSGSIPGVNTDQMKLQIKLGVPHSVQQSLDIERVKSVFPYGQILNVEVVDGGMICSSGVCLEAMGDKNDDCYIVNAAVYVGY
ncbi:hypothetical protein MA16_Dca004107 [Dendrobium catenatum]|uniref:Uncharacterized protein n=1 Tax=Dendrobium catenatum TaxID=906689 RepID=A0A2I0X2F9_9ASPA|nr:hypothetical protein MA16_Dca004107 [Dendrobium catenatum]